MMGDDLTSLPMRRTYMDERRTMRRADSIGEGVCNMVVFLDLAATMVMVAPDGAPAGMAWEGLPPPQRHGRRQLRGRPHRD